MVAWKPQILGYKFPLHLHLIQPRILGLTKGEETWSLTSVADERHVFALGWDEGTAHMVWIAREDHKLPRLLSHWLQSVCLLSSLSSRLSRRRLRALAHTQEGVRTAHARVFTHACSCTRVRARGCQQPPHVFLICFFPPCGIEVHKEYLSQPSLCCYS